MTIDDVSGALRHENASYHYLPPAPYSHLRAELADILHTAWDCVAA